MSSDDLGGLTGPDEARAREAFERLARRARPFLLGFLARRGAGEDAEDLTEQTLASVWKARENLDLPDEVAWRAVLCRIARNALCDLVRKNPSRDANLDEIPEPAASDRNVLNVLLAGQIYAAADALWLGEAGPDADRRLLAAMLHLKGRPSGAIARVFGPDAVDDGFSDPAVLRRLAFRELYWSNERLAARVLGVPSEDLPAVARGERVPAEWPPEETRIVLAYVRYRFLKEQIAHHLDRSVAEIAPTLTRCVERYPMPAKARALARSLPRGILEPPDLWKRLALEYFGVDRLPVPHIYERTSGSAAEAGYTLTKTMVEGWITVGRLFAALAKFIEARA